MNVNVLLEQGIAKILHTAGRFYMSSQRGRAFLAEIVPAAMRSADIRRQRATQGLQVPAFLIASIASQCNLRCAGCYARAGGGCGSTPRKQDLSTDQWRTIFSQAAALGVSFVLLAGGEPFLRRDILTLASEFPQMVFPIFTNGTMLDKEALQLLDKHRNLVPILSIEGEQVQTDSRRGAGTYIQIENAMDALHKRQILFGTSVTVTKNNIGLVTGAPFVQSLYDRGCGLTLYVEYVPAEAGTEQLVLEEAELEQLQAACAVLKKQFDRMIILSFPGDEQSMGGCLASGRGFFHINPQGDAEPCPFSPYARQNLQSASIAEVLQSAYFSELRKLAADVGHHGGCTLFAKSTEVQYLMAQ